MSKSRYLKVVSNTGLLSLLVAFGVLLGSALGQTVWDDLQARERVGDWRGIISIVEQVPPDVRQDYRLAYFRASALFHLNRFEEGDREVEHCGQLMAGRPASETDYVRSRLSASRRHAVAALYPAPGSVPQYQGPPQYQSPPQYGPPAQYGSPPQYPPVYQSSPPSAGSSSSFTPQSPPPAANAGIGSKSSGIELTPNPNPAGIQRSKPAPGKGKGERPSQPTSR